MDVFDHVVSKLRPEGLELALAYPAFLSDKNELVVTDLKRCRNWLERSWYRYNKKNSSAGACIVVTGQACSHVAQPSSCTSFTLFDINNENVHHHIHVDAFSASAGVTEPCMEAHHMHPSDGGQHAHQDIVIQTCFSSSHQNGAPPQQHRHLHLDLYTPSSAVDEQFLASEQYMSYLLNESLLDPTMIPLCESGPSCPSLSHEMTFNPMPNIPAAVEPQLPMQNQHSQHHSYSFLHSHNHLSPPSLPTSLPMSIPISSAPPPPTLPTNLCSTRPSVSTNMNMPQPLAFDSLLHSQQLSQAPVIHRGPPLVASNSLIPPAKASTFSKTKKYPTPKTAVQMFDPPFLANTGSGNQTTSINDAAGHTSDNVVKPRDLHEYLVSIIISTPVWRRDPEGNVVCNACNLFEKNYGKKRPPEMRADFVKRRRRRNAKLENDDFS
ncbi:hypothetical protein SeMB42_g00631 [Synchytrium endobioticum]|uniref:GATA-type domain-containing protein n=1 Tax=Synchytrium endobioticum TaxID=286115 RepID=A0A507DQ54_9FUNG|nr:hypothetical protein SeMB42_g00631 [Synchytrium endobioticum]